MRGARTHARTHPLDEDVLAGGHGPREAAAPVLQLRVLVPLVLREERVLEDVCVPLAPQVVVALRTPRPVSPPRRLIVLRPDRGRSI